MAKTGWKLEYINHLPFEHLMFCYHWLRKVEQDQWNQLGAQLGTTWDRSELMRLSETPAGAKEGSTTVFVPLSLVINPDLVEGLLNKANRDQKQPSTGPVSTPSAPLPPGDGLHTGMPIPKGEEVVNMATMSKNEFLGHIQASGLPTKSSKK